MGKQTQKKKKLTKKERIQKYKSFPIGERFQKMVLDCKTDRELSYYQIAILLNRSTMQLHNLINSGIVRTTPVGTIYNFASLFGLNLFEFLEILEYKNWIGDSDDFEDWYNDNKK